ncbi:MAG: VCBS repeat-containing protein [Cyclobacteriaceae bacterium]|nr:VCBS repeat-containing protein [Cyclobacteriaceae bacterium]
MGATSSDQGQATTTDASGNVYFTGWFTGTADFDPGPGVVNLTPNGSLDVFVTKFDANRNLVWAIKMGGFSADQGQAIAVDGSGNVYVAGYFTGTGTFGGSSLSSAGGSDAFVCKLNSSGVGQWGRRVGGTGSDTGYSIAVDGAGNVMVAGTFNSLVDFDPGAGTLNLTSFGFSDAFVFSLNTSGTFRWAKQMGGPSYDYGYGVACDGAGNAVTTGYFDDTANFDPAVTDFSLSSNSGTYDVYVTKLANANGNLIWAKSMGGDSGDFGMAIDVDASDNVYTTGYFQFGAGNPADYDPGPGVFNLIPTPGSSIFAGDVFVSKLDASGNFVWAAKMGGTDMDEGYGIAVDVAQNVYVTGNFAGTADFDPGTPTFDLVSQGDRDIFNARLDGSGNFSWAFSTGGGLMDMGLGIALDPSSNIITTGMFAGTVDFAPGACVVNLSALLSNSDIFITKIAPSPPPAPVITGFVPMSGTPGTVVTISGNNFSTTPANNVVTFNGNPAVVTASTATSITTMVPVGTLTGPITLDIGCLSTQSADAFTATGPCNIPTVQRNALIDLYTNANGASWNNKTNWLSADESTWFGITVTGCRVTAIDLPFNNLFGPLNETLTNITTLERLKLNGNLLNGALPSSIGNLTSLIEINVQSNQMSGSLPPSLAQCTSLENLHLEGNDFLDILPSFLTGMTNLRSINLGFNRFLGSIPPEMGNLTNLTFLSLASNNLGGTIPPEIGNLTNLQLLDLSRNSLAGNIPPALENLTSLQFLQLWSNQLDGPIPPELGNMNSLISLNLGQNEITGTVPTELGNLSTLIDLFLDHNQLSGAFPASVAALDLEVVHIENNTFTAIPTFDDEFITELWVANNQLEFDDLEPNLPCSGFSYSPQRTLPPGGTITVAVGGTLNIPFSSPGSANLFQWFKDGQPLVGFTSPTLNRPGMTSADGGIYYVEVTSTLVTGLTLQSDPYLVLTDPCIASTPTGGDLDTTFDPLIDIPTSVVALGLQSDGSIIAATGPTSIDGNLFDGIVKFSTDGILDGSFSANTIHSRAGQLIVQPDDKILTTAGFGAFDAFSDIIRLNADLTDDTGFNASIDTETINGIGLQPDGKILVSYNSEASPTFLARLETDGFEDFTFSAPFDMPASIIKVQSDDYILIAGNFPNWIARLDPNGSIDPTFTPQVNGMITEILIQPDDNILIAGSFTNVNGVPKLGLARLLPDGQLDDTFIAAGITDGLMPIHRFTRMALQSDGKIVLGGLFDSVNGRNIRNLVRLNTDGTMDCAFDTGSGPDATVWDVAIEADEQIVISGDFTNYNGAVRNGLARVNNGSTGPPTITSFSPASGAIGATVTITGTNFSPIAANNIVYFGATKTIVSAATPTQLNVTVPPGATFEPITATVGSLTAYAPRPFVPTFAGGSPIVPASFAAHVDFTNPAAPKSINIGDLDGDGLADMVVSSQSGTTGIISVFRNTSTPGTIAAGSFAPPVDFLKPNSIREGMSLADIDGDGKLEIVAVDTNNDRVSIYLNLAVPGTLDATSFATPLEFNVGINDAPTNVDVEDLDADGLPEIVTSDFLRDRITIIQNTSSPGTITFRPRFYIPAGDGATDIAIRDFNNDGKPDLAVANELANTVSVLENASIPGLLSASSFSPAVDFVVNNGPTKLSIGDIDGDGSQDIITANLGTSNSVSILRNILTGGPINPGAFASAVNFTTAGPNNSVELADLNGDGKIDVVTALPGGSPQIAVLQNASTPGSLSLNAFVGFAAGAGTFEVALGDLDNDGQTDIATANSGDNTVSVLRFNSAPTITITLQPSDAVVCEGATAAFNTAATGTTNIIYQWQFSPDGIVPFVDIADGGGYSGVTTTTLSVNTTGGFGEGRYQCRINGDLAAEVLTADEGLFINPLPAAPGASGGSNCGGGTVILTATGATDGEYRWYTTSSGGSPITGAVNAAFTTPVITVTTTYHVAVHNGTCESSTRTPVVATINTPPAPPSALGASSCIAAAITLTASGGVNGDYRWYTVATGGTAIPGEVNDSYTTPVISTTTNYYVALFDGTCESTRVPAVATIEVVAKPAIATSNCTATGATLTGPAGFSGYTWSNGGTTQQISVTVAGAYTLTVTSSGGCLSPVSDPVSFTAAFCNQPPVVQPTTVTTTIQGTVTINISTLISDLDNNIDMTTLQVLVQPLSGAAASVNANFEIVVDYSMVSFAGTDQLTIQVCDVSSACVQQVITIEVAGDITVYNALSPNGDGKNDVFFIQYINALPETQENKVTILNRWGSVVFETINYDNTNNVFRGLSSSGAELPSGTYYYILEFTSGAAKRTGFLSLRR